MDDDAGLTPEVARVLLEAELRSFVLPRVMRLMERLCASYRPGAQPAPGWWLAAMYGAGALLLATWEVARADEAFARYRARLVAQGGQADGIAASGSSQRLFEELDRLCREARAVVAGMAELLVTHTPSNGEEPLREGD